MTFTAPALREMAEELDNANLPWVDSHWTPLADALRAYAARLDQDERDAENDPKLAGMLDMSTAGFQFMARCVEREKRKGLEHGREEGRREVYAEIAAMQPWEAYSDHDAELCRFCLCGIDHHHTPDCLWLRAQPPAPVTP